MAAAVPPRSAPRRGGRRPGRSRAAPFRSPGRRWRVRRCHHQPLRVSAHTPLAREQAAYLYTETARLRSWVERSRAAGGLSVKRLERKLLSAEEKVKTRLAAKTDDGVTFEQTGVDYVYLDEAHLFKNLCTESNIPSADIDGSNRAQDLDMKLDWLRRHNPTGRCATFATATPVANSVTEAYVMQHYLRPDLLASARDRGLRHLGRHIWRGRPRHRAVPRRDQLSRSVSRFAKFANVPELLRMFHVPADVKTADDLKLPTPAIVGGKPETVVVPTSPELTTLSSAPSAPGPRRCAPGRCAPRKTTC